MEEIYLINLPVETGEFNVEVTNDKKDAKMDMIYFDNTMGYYTYSTKSNIEKNKKLLSRELLIYIKDLMDSALGVSSKLIDYIIQED